VSHTPSYRALLGALSLLVVLALAAPAGAAAGGGVAGWPRSKEIQRLHYEYGPLDVKPGQNTIENAVLAEFQKPKVDGYIIRMKPDLRFMDGTVPPVDVVHLHHGVWLNASGYSPAGPIGNLEPIFFGGEEKTVFQIPEGYGYPYKKKDVWVLNHMIHNNTSTRMQVRLTWDIDFVRKGSPLARSVKAVEPLWMDVRRGWGYPVFDVLQTMGGRDGTYTFPTESPIPAYPIGPPQNEFVLPQGGTLVSGIGHLHPGGLHDDIDVVRDGRSARILRTDAKYYDPVGPISWDMSIRASKPDWRVRVEKGDMIRITSSYETGNGSWYESMGLALLYFAPDDATGVDPFSGRVDWRGKLTHGQLPENDNHGGGEAVLPDARRAADGAPTTSVDIRGFVFRPGDLGLLAAGAKVPLVPRGQSLTFTSREDTKVAYHTITACKEPCNRTTGISYPLANGRFQFDSGELGFGPVGLTPAANRAEWKTPPDLQQGTYTYFCRIHNFMRGAFRVR